MYFILCIEKTLSKVINFYLTDKKDGLKIK